MDNHRKGYISLIYILFGLNFLVSYGLFIKLKAASPCNAQPIPINQQHLAIIALLYVFILICLNDYARLLPRRGNASTIITISSIYLFLFFIGYLKTQDKTKPITLNVLFCIVLFIIINAYIAEFGKAS